LDRLGYAAGERRARPIMKTSEPESSVMPSAKKLQPTAADHISIVFGSDAPEGETGLPEKKPVWTKPGRDFQREVFSLTGRRQDSCCGPSERTNWTTSSAQPQLSETPAPAWP
jgi:hypothetical protein